MIMTDSDYDKLFWFDTPLLLIHLCTRRAIQMDDGKWTGWTTCKTVDNAQKNTGKTRKKVKKKSQPTHESVQKSLHLCNLALNNNIY